MIKFLTPVQLWQDFDPVSAPLDMAIAYSAEEGDLRRKGVFFTAVSDEVGQVRAFAEIKTAVPQPKKVLVSVLTEPDQTPITDSFDDLLKRGFAVVTVDVSGIPDEDGNATKYSEGYEYASFAAGTPDRYLASPSAKSSPVYLWAKIVRRTVTLVDYLYPDAHTSVMGALSAADVAWQVASMDARIAALIAVLGDYSDPPVSEDEDSSNADSYVMALSAKSAARLMKCPVLIVTCANAHGGDVEKISEVVNQISENVPFTLTVTPRLNRQIDEADLLSAYKWLDKTLKGDTSPDLRLTAEQAEGVFRAGLSSFNGKISSAILHVSYNNPPAEYRHWHEFPMKKREDGGFTAEVPVWVGDREILAYATAQVGGMDLATKGMGTLVSSLQPYHVSQFLLDTESDHGFYTDNSVRTFISHKDDFAVSEAPDGVPGFCGKGMLRTNIFAEDGRYETASSLHISVYSKVDSQVRITLIKREEQGILAYTAVCKAEGEEWTRLSIEAEDFKTEDLIPMRDWDGLLGMILPDTDDKYYNNFLWM